MPFRANKNIVIWAILALCIVAIPVGLLTAVQKSGEDLETDLDTAMFKPDFDHLLVLELKGMIMNGPDESVFAKEGTANWLKRRLKDAQKSKRVKGLLLRINSPGGTVATSQELFQSVVKFKDSGKPIVVSMGDVTASGGYYVACAGDKIVAEPGTITGSIGVIMNLMNLEGVERKIGIDPFVIKSGKFKDIGSPNRPMTEEERELLKSIIMDSYDQFVEAVASGRKMSIDAVHKVADGRILSGRQAKAAGLVDELGGYDEAVDTLQELAKQKYGHTKDLKVVDKRMPTFMSLLLQAQANDVSQSSLFERVFPANLGLTFHKQPLWLMQ